MSVVTPIVIKLFEPINPISQEGALLPPYAATVDMPRCLLGQHPVDAPGKMGYFKTPDKEAMFVICERCAAKVSDADLEAKVIENLLDVDASPEKPVPAATPAPAKQEALAARAARDWVAAAAQDIRSTPAP
jgi:hypothetical protein